MQIAIRTGEAVPVTIDQYAKLSNLILAAAMDPAEWQQVVDLLGVVLGTQICTQLMGYDSQSKAAPLAFSSGYDPEILKLYEEEYYCDNPYAQQFDSLVVGKVTPATELCSPDVMTKTGFYSDLLRPQEDIIYGGGALLARDDSRMFLFGGNMRAKDEGKYEQRWLTLCNSIVPILSQSLEINRTISGLSFEKWAANQHKLGAQTAIIVIDTDLRVHYASSLADRLLANGDLIKTGISRQLRFNSGAVQSGIAHLAKQHASGAQAVHKSWRIDTGSTERWVCRAVGLRLGDLDRSPMGAFFDRSTSAILLALKAETPQIEIEGIVQGALGPSQVETRITLMLAEGMTAAEVADHRNVSIHTVRNQIKSALSKAGCRRQADLIKAVEQLRSASPRLTATIT